MLRQLKDAPPDLRVEVTFARTSETTACLLPAAREDPKVLLSATDPKREPRAFDLALTRPMGKKRGRGCYAYYAVRRHAEGSRLPLSHHSNIRPTGLTRAPHDLS
jgi:hypothetical protein